MTNTDIQGIIRSLIAGLEEWGAKAAESAEALDRAAQEAAPIATVGEDTYTMEGWVANEIRDVAGPDHLGHLIGYLSKCLDLGNTRMRILEWARDELERERATIEYRRLVEKTVNGESTPNDRRGLFAIVRNYWGRDRDVKRAARWMGVDAKDLEAALPALQEQWDVDRPHMTC